MNSHEVFIHIHQGCFAGSGAIVRLPQCQWSKPDGYGKISQGITTTKHSKAKTVCIFLEIYCITPNVLRGCIYLSMPLSWCWFSLYIFVNDAQVLFTIRLSWHPLWFLPCMAIVDYYTNQFIAPKRPWLLILLRPLSPRYQVAITKSMLVRFVVVIYWGNTSYSHHYVYVYT